MLTALLLGVDAFGGTPILDTLWDLVGDSGLTGTLDELALELGRE